jgi:hypothetical protein
MTERRKTKSGGIPQAAVSLLKKAGWNAKRVVPTSLYEQAFESEGITLLSKTKEFLSEFGGLIVPYRTIFSEEDVLEFLADQAVQGMGGDSEFEEMIGVGPLCPIGHYLYGKYILFMDNQGRVFGGSDENVILVGKTGKEAIGNILTGVESEVLEPKTI